VGDDESCGCCVVVSMVDLLVHDRGRYGPPTEFLLPVMPTVG